jgi:hypothetical protein
MRGKDWGFVLFMYIFIGIFVFIFCVGGEHESPGLPFQQSLGVAIIWPLFILKYLALAIVFVGQGIGSGFGVFWS